MTDIDEDISKALSNAERSAAAKLGGEPVGRKEANSDLESCATRGLKLRKAKRDLGSIASMLAGMYKVYRRSIRSPKYRAEVLRILSETHEVVNVTDIPNALALKYYYKRQKRTTATDRYGTAVRLLLARKIHFQSSAIKSELEKVDDQLKGFVETYSKIITDDKRQQDRIIKFPGPVNVTLPSALLGKWNDAKKAKKKRLKIIVKKVGDGYTIDEITSISSK